MDIIKDSRVDCFSIMEKMVIKDYLKLIQYAYENKGNLEGQRLALKTKSAITIRNRMHSDILKGTVLPPVVIGIVVGEELFNEFNDLIDTENIDEIRKLIMTVDDKDISIIDGMQRTTSLMEASDKNEEILDRETRVEFWVTKNVNSLIYRMLILNTGQVPWNLKRQIEVVFNPLIKEIGKNVDTLELISIDDPSYRTAPGQYQSEKIIELFLVFGTREAKIDTKGALADEFTRLDFIEVTSDNQLSEFFIEFLKIMIELDRLVFNISLGIDVADDDKFKNGRDIFGSQTLKAGFMAAISQYIFGLPGEEYSLKEQKDQSTKLIGLFNNFIVELKSKTTEELIEYIDFMTLNQIMRTVNKGIGDFERKFFTIAFETLISKEFRFKNLTPCWRAGKK